MAALCARRFAQAVTPQAKTDAVDARILATMGAAVQTSQSPALGADRTSGTTQDNLPPQTLRHHDHALRWRPLWQGASPARP